MPEWVSVWAWLRYLRAPTVTTPLPHQGIDPQAMSMTVYETFHSEWVKAGKPSMTVNTLVAAMTGNPLIEMDDGIPF